MATAQNTGTNSLTKVLESICRERRREHLDKESEGTFDVSRLTWISLKLINNWILVIRAIKFDWVLPREIYACKNTVANVALWKRNIFVNGCSFCPAIYLKIIKVNFFGQLRNYYEMKQKCHDLRVRKFDVCVRLI